MKFFSPIFLFSLFFSNSFGLPSFYKRGDYWQIGDVLKGFKGEKPIGETEHYSFGWNNSQTQPNQHVQQQPAPAAQTNQQQQHQQQHLASSTTNSNESTGSSNFANNASRKGKSTATSSPKQNH